MLEIPKLAMTPVLGFPRKRVKNHNQLTQVQQLAWAWALH